MLTRWIYVGNDGEDVKIVQVSDDVTSVIAPSNDEDESDTAVRSANGGFPKYPVEIAKWKTVKSKKRCKVPKPIGSGSREPPM